MIQFLQILYFLFLISYKFVKDLIIDMTKQLKETTSNYIKQQIFADPDFIKKTKINYLNCDCKGLHQGEKLVLVCLDANCKNKGLICPVCKQQTHKNHQVLHLKVFLGELQAKLIKRPTGQDNQQTQQNHQFATKTLAQHLNDLQTAKKSIMMNLQESVKNLALAVKQIQKKIQDQYIRIRKIILSQKSFQSRLPRIYNILLTQNQDQKNQEEVKEEIKKLTELLQKNIKKDEVKVVNNADKVVELYKQNSDTCTTHLLSLMTDLPKKISQLPVKLKSIISQDQDKNRQKTKKIEYTFSQNLRAASVLVSEDKKSVGILGPDEVGGLVFINGQDQNNSQIRKISLKITSSVSDSISLGVGDVQKIKQIGFTVQQMQYDGLFGICAMGININDIQSPTFVFSQGDIIQITFDPQQSILTFGRRNGIEHQQIDVGLPQNQSKKLKFFTSLLLYGDSVEIVL